MKVFPILLFHTVHKTYITALRLVVKCKHAVFAWRMKDSDGLGLGGVGCPIVPQNRITTTNAALTTSMLDILSVTVPHQSVM